MENQTRYDLNEAIEIWRAEVAAQPNLTAEVRRELETHLRDANAGFQQCSLNDEESFWLACKRVGQPPQLGEEFVKANPAAAWRERLFWMWLAVFLSSIWGSLTTSVFVASHKYENYIGKPLRVTLPTVAILVPVIIGVLLAKGKLAARFSRLRLFVENRLRLALTALLCIVISSSIQMIAWAVGSYIPSPVKQGFALTIHPVIAAFLPIWITPPQNRKAAKRA